MTEELQHITSLEEYEKLIKENKFLFVDFFAEWCGPCRYLGPIFAAQAKIFTEAKFIKVDVDQAKEISQKEEVHCMPTLIFYKDGEKKERFEGADKKLLIKTLYSITGKEKVREPGILDTLQEYETLISEKKLLVVYFAGSDRYPGSENFTAAIQSYIKEKDEKLKEVEFKIVDLDDTKEQKEISEKANVTEKPTTIFFKDGKEVDRYKGASKKCFTKKLEAFLGLPSSLDKEYPTTVDEYKTYLKSNPLVVSVFLREYGEEISEQEALIDKFEKDEEWKDLKFIRIYLEQSIEVFREADPDGIPAFVCYKEGEKVKEYDGTDDFKLKRVLCKLAGKPVPKIEGQIDDLKEFEDFIKENKLVAVDFFAQWCGPCKRISPIFHDLSTKDEFKEIKFTKVDVDEGTEISQKYQIEAMPTFMFFKEGNKSSVFSGADDKKLKKELYKLMGKIPPKEEDEIREVAEFEEIIKANKFVYLGFFNEAESDNEKVESIFDRYLKEKLPKMKLIKANVAYAKEIADKVGVTKFPLLVIYEDGKEIKKVESTDPDELLEAAENVLPLEGEPFNTNLHEHPLYPKKKSSFICSYCNEGFFRCQEGYHYCRDCKFILCYKCKEKLDKNEEIVKREIIHSQEHKDHPLYFTGRNTARCDICRKDLEVSFCCVKCDFDLCEDCYKKEKEAEPYNTKLHEHPLYPRKLYSFICKNCNEGFYRNDKEIQACRNCDYVLCYKCKEKLDKNEEITKREIINSKHHTAHPLYFSGRERCRCDICRKDLEVSYCCLKCDFDLCEECLKKEKEEKTDEKK